MQETARCCFSHDKFSWREFTIHGPPGSQPAVGCTDGGTVDETALAGGFHYRGSALVSSPCRNRFILWHYQDATLDLLEVSMDTNLAHNALRLQLTDGGVLLPRLCVQELGNAHLVLLFTTTAAVYRLVLPHPEAIVKDHSLTLAGDGSPPSVFAFVKADSFQGANSAPLFPDSSNTASVTSCGGWVSISGLSTFALPSPSGAIYVIQLPPPGSHGPPMRTELKETSVMQRLWTSFIPSSMRGSTEADSVPASVAVHVFSGETIVLALCRDLSLRLWSCQQAQCLMTHSLLDYLTLDQERLTGRVEKLLLKTAPGGTPTALRFGLYLGIRGTPQISLFELLLVDNQLKLNHLMNYSCPEGCTLIDFQPSNREVWGVWSVRVGEDEGEETQDLVQHATYVSDGLLNPPTPWQRVILAPPPPREVVMATHKDARETYLDELLHPGRFTSLAINKALELYGASSSGTSLCELGSEATRRVEQELHSSASSSELHQEEFRELLNKCWAKFYGCCLQYQQLLSSPCGLTLDPGTGLVCLLQKENFSFIRPADPVRATLALPDVQRDVVGMPLAIRDPVLASDVTLFTECIRLTTKQLWQLSPVLLDSFLVDLGYHGNDPTLLATELASVLLNETEEASSRSFVMEVKKTLGQITDLPAVLSALSEALDPSASSEEVEGDGGEEDVRSELQLAISQLFTSQVAVVTLGAAFRETCFSRLQLCRDVLVLLCVVQEGGWRLPSSSGPQGVQGHTPMFATLLQCYHLLHWLASRPVLHTPGSSLESNLQQLAALDISSASGKGSSRNPDCTLPELYLSSDGGRNLRVRLTRGRVLVPDAPLHPFWVAVVPWVIDRLVEQLWPFTNSVKVCEFLLATHQHTHLQDYIQLLDASSDHRGYSSLQFQLGLSLFSTGELLKARDCFLEAARGVGDPSEVVLRRFVAGGEGEEREGVTGVGRLVEYYIKVMRLFEQVSAPTFVISVATVATGVASADDPNCALLWSNLFKHHLELEHWVEAYEAMAANPDSERRKDCLRRFVVVLTEQRKLKEICSFQYSGMEEEIERVIEGRARGVDITGHCYYDLLYCFHMKRGNHRKAAYVMYEHGLRLGREAPGPKSLQKQADCYCMTLTLLDLIDPKYAWVVRPVELETVSQAESAKRKRAHPSQKGHLRQQVEVLTRKDIEKDYVLVKAKLSLLQKDDSFASRLSSPFVSVDEVVALLVQVGLFDTAIDTALRFSIPLMPIFESLAARCVHLSVNVVTFRRGAGDMSSLEWLGTNSVSGDVAAVRESSIADRAWSLLRHHLEKLDCHQGYQLQKVVARKLFSMGAQLPQWMVDRYKISNPAELLRLYLTFNLLDPACRLALEYIKAVMGHGKQFYGLESALHTTSPSVWLPYSALDHLQQALKDAPSDSTLAELSENLDSKLEHYFQSTASVSQIMEQEANHRHRSL